MMADSSKTPNRRNLVVEETNSSISAGEQEYKFDPYDDFLKEKCHIEQDVLIPQLTINWAKSASKEAGNI